MAKNITKRINSGYYPTYFNNSITTYGLGSWLKKAGEDYFGAVKDAVVMGADNTLGAFGAGDVIGDKAYTHDIFRKASDFTSTKLAPVAGQLLANTVAPGVGGQVLGGVQRGVSSALGNTSSDEQPSLTRQLNTTTLNNTLKTPYNYAPVMANGGMVSPYEFNSLCSGGKLKFGGGGEINSLEPYNNYYDAQAIYTKALADKYPKIPIKDILDNYAKDSTFNHNNMSKYVKNLQDKYGDIYLDENDIKNLVSEGYPNILDLDKEVKNSDAEAFGTIVGTKGKKENALGKFGFRMMLERAYPKGETPYKYLKEKADGGYFDEYDTGGSMNFKSKGAYKKWLGYVHSKGLAESTPGHQKVSIKGSPHKVQHTDGGNLDNTTYYAAGGSHQSNINGGIPIGKNALVEEGEYRYDSPKRGSYIFSARF